MFEDEDKIRLGGLIKLVEQHEKSLQGNGQKGLIPLVTELNLRLTNNEQVGEKLNKSIEDLTHKISDLTVFKYGVETEARCDERDKAAKSQSKRDFKWLLGLVVATIPYVIMFIQWLKT